MSRVNIFNKFKITKDIIKAITILDLIPDKELETDKLLNKSIKYNILLIGV